MTSNEQFNSAKFWETRYQKGGNSGAGSYGRLCDYKAKYINDTVRAYKIDTVIEFGCGDSNQCSTFEFEHYTGVDVSEYALNLCKNRFSDKKNWNFYNLNTLSVSPHDLSMSLDVIYHLIEDEVYEKYMNDLFNHAKKYVLIYASDFEGSKAQNQKHVKHRNFSKWIKDNKPDWHLIESPEQPFKYADGKSAKNHSFASFKLFVHKDFKQTIRAHMATYPARSEVLKDAVENILKQIDHLYIVLNEYTEIPSFLLNEPKITAVIPERDLKDVGKFYFQPNPDDIVLMVDDDLIYDKKYVEESVRQARLIGLDNHVFGYHCTIYTNQNIKTVKEKKVYPFARAYPSAMYVNQIGTGTAVALGKNIPLFSYMESSQKFVDVRFAKWAFEQNINLVRLARRFGFIKPAEIQHPNSIPIYKQFTRNSPQCVINEINTFAGKSLISGQVIDLSF